jgi:SAM-dependent methyltransferase
VAGRDVLEVGCGTAARAPAVIHWGGRYSGLEDDLPHVEAARRRLVAGGLPGRVTLGSVHDLVPLGDGVFDVVFNADGAYEYVPHLPTALAAIARVLRPRGRCALMAVSPFFDGFPLGGLSDRSLMPVRSYFDRAPRLVAGQRGLRYHRTVGDWLAAFGAAGLVVNDALELEPFPRDWRPGTEANEPGWEQLAMLPYTMIWRAYKPG